MSSTPSHIPRLVYGTAFKGEETAKVVHDAFTAGFRAFDTAGVKSTYKEFLLGEAIQELLSSGKVTREELIIQTKWSPFKAGRDHAIYPYDPTAAIDDQVKQSVDSSLRNLFGDSSASAPSSDAYIDVFLIHNPSPDIADTILAYQTLCTFVPHKIRHIGLSNFHLGDLHTVYNAASIKPTILQNRFTGSTDQTLPVPSPLTPWDEDVRTFCEEKGITYQVWGSMWWNDEMLHGDAVTEVGEMLDVSVEVAWKLCILGLGDISMLVGTGKEARMTACIEGQQKFEEWWQSSDSSQKWADIMERLRNEMAGA